MSHDRHDLRNDLLLVGGLIAFDLLARLLPHVPGVWPFAASALFAGRVLRIPPLALVVPVVAILVTNLALEPEDWRIIATVCVASAVPALAGIASRRYGGALPVIAAMLGSSIVFFLATNFAVWAFGSLYSHDWSGLVECYVLALPFLERTVLGDLIWCGALFGGYALLTAAPRLLRRSV